MTKAPKNLQTIESHVLDLQRLHPSASGDFTSLLNDISFAAKVVSRDVTKAGLVEDILGATDVENVQGEIIQKLLAAIGIETRIRAIPVGVAKTAGTICESAWKVFGLKSEPPVTRFSVEQLATAHWFDTSAAERDFGYVPAITIAEGLEILRKSGL